MSSAIEGLFAEQVGDLALRRGAEALGRLAAWWIRPELLESIGLSPSAVGDVDAGEFVVLLVRAAPSSAVMPGFGVPMRWRRSTRPDQRLPASMAALARQVRDACAALDGNALRFQLELGNRCPDLSMLDIPAESAGAMLTATLRASCLGVAIDAMVTATAELGASDLRPVRGLPEKLDAARRLGLRQVFVSRLESIDARSGAELGIQLEGKNAEEQLQRLLLALDAPPSGGDLAARCEWYDRHSADAGERARAADFFARSLARDLAAVQRAERPRAGRACSMLILIASGRPEPAALSAWLHEPPEILLLHDASPQGTRNATEARAALESAAVRASIRSCELPAAGDDPAAFLSRLADVLESACDGERSGACIDLTGGTSLMKLCLSEAARARGLRRFVVDQREQTRGGSPRVRSLRVIEIADSTDR